MIAVGLGQHSAVYRSSGSRGLLQIDCHENGQWCCAVSYTHLTLPTIYSV